MSEPRKLAPAYVSEMFSVLKAGGILGEDEVLALESMFRDLQRHYPPVPNPHTYLRTGTKNPRHIYMHPGTDFTHPGEYIGTMASAELAAWVCRALNLMNGKTTAPGRFTPEDDG